MPETRNPSPETRSPKARKPDSPLLTVGELAERAGVSVRTLHHYDGIGLLNPTDRTDAGYRLYAPADQERLHQVLLFRELGLSLEAIREVLDDPAVDRRATLHAQRRALEVRRRGTEALIRAVDRAIEALERGGPMNTNELFEGFDEFDHAQYADEARERWGDTDAYRESARRTKEYGKPDRAAMTAELDAIMARMVELMGAGADPTGEEAMDVAEEHRAHIGRWFYPCHPRMHAGLADMYESDARFGEFFESRAAGLTTFFSAAVRANAGRVEA